MLATSPARSQRGGGLEPSPGEKTEGPLSCSRQRSQAFGGYSRNRHKPKDGKHPVPESEAWNHKHRTGAITSHGMGSHPQTTQSYTLRAISSSRVDLEVGQNSESAYPICRTSSTWLLFRALANPRFPPTFHLSSIYSSLFEAF